MIKLQRLERYRESNEYVQDLHKASMGLDPAGALLQLGLHRRHGAGQLYGNGAGGGLPYTYGEYRPRGASGPDVLPLERDILGEWHEEQL